MIQIIGIITSSNIEIRKSTYKEPIFHCQYWKNAKKRWRYNRIDGIIESELSPESLTNDDYKRIKNFLEERGLYETMEDK